MINRDMKTVTLNRYSATVDEYGQGQTTVSSTKTITMCIQLHTETNVDSPSYTGCKFIGLTKDKTVTENDKVLDGTTLYDIMYVIPSNRYTQVFMNEHK